jgi:hypothetical protein
MITLDILLKELQTNYSEINSLFEKIAAYLDSGSGPLPDCGIDLEAFLSYDAFLTHANNNIKEMGIRQGTISDYVYYVSSLLREVQMLGVHKAELYQLRLDELGYDIDRLNSKLGSDLNYIRGTSALQEFSLN